MRIEDLLRIGRLAGWSDALIFISSGKTKDGWKLRIRDPVSGKYWYRYYRYRADAIEFKSKMSGRTAQKILEVHGEDFLAE